MSETNARRKTVADIMAEYRADMDAADRGDLPLPTTGYVRILLDRIGAIWKREKAAIEADALAVGGVVEAARELSKKRPKSGGELGQFGNAAAMRKALATLRKRFDNNTMAYQDRYFKFSRWHWHKKAKEAAWWRDVFHELREVCDAALSAPPRNCDVGTAEEQSSRMEQEVCNKGMGCARCALRALHNERYSDCSLRWAQMPYETKEGDAK